MAVTPSQVLAQLAALPSMTPSWFDDNAFAPEYIYPEAWSQWDWVQFGGVGQNKTPLQADVPTPVASGLIPTLFTFLAKVEGKYEIYFDKRTTPGKPATNTALYAKQNEVKIRLFIITPFDLLQVGQLIRRCAAIFPANTISGRAVTVPIFHPKLSLFQRNNFILVSMTYVEEPREGKPAYVDTVWLPQDIIIAGQAQVTTSNTGYNNVYNVPPGPVSEGPATSMSENATPPPTPNPDNFVSAAAQLPKF